MNKRHTANSLNSKPESELSHRYTSRLRSAVLTLVVQSTVMSALLDDIIHLAEESSQPLPDILRKFLRLGHELKNDRLKTWSSQELNGYKCEKDQLPEYRIVPAQAHGDFVSRFHQVRDRVIPPAVLQENHRNFASQILLADSVGVYAELVRTSTTGKLIFPWPADMVGYYQHRLLPDMVLYSAYQRIPTSVLAGMLDVTRTRTLKLALEIKDELGTSYDDLNRIEPEQAERVRSVVINNLGGNVALGDVDASGCTTIIAGDRRTLDAALTKAGMNPADLTELTEAIQADGDRAGSKVKKWISDKSEKMLVGGVKIGASIAQQVLTQWLMQHYGLRP
jgi:hypothetical protein